MKNTFILFAVIFALSCFSLTGCMTTSANTSKEIRNVKDFTGIDLAISADVYITQGQDFKVEINADDEDLKEIETEVYGNTLKIKTKNWHDYIHRGTIYITMPEVEALSIAGSGSIYATSQLKTADLELHISGSGSIILDNLSASRLDSEITGSGGIKLTGSNTVNNTEITITGSGNYDASRISAKEVGVRITGSGSAKVNALERLNTNITGSGEVNYSGRPMVNATSTGSGKTRAVN